MKLFQSQHKGLVSRTLALLFLLLLPGVFLMSSTTDTSKIPPPPAPQEKPLFIILFGAPGSGKGTQAALLSAKYHFVHISTGDMFRENILNNTPLGLKAKEYIEKGELVPDTVVIDMLKERLQKPDCKQGVLLDGFPRNVNQAQALEEILKSYTPLVLSYDISDDAVLKRLGGRRTCSNPQCGRVYHIVYSPPKVAGECDVCHKPLITRPDDTESVIRTRLQVFHSQTEPVKEYYAKKGMLKNLNAEKTPEEISAQTALLIDPLLNKTPSKKTN